MDSDLSAEQQAARILNESTYGDLRTVTASCQSGRVTLHGAVPSYFLKQVAQELVRRVDGIHRVVNHIEVR
jgi:osmotically-inducible protein OsmY